jgi:4'-phosphopantetheinyl transferase
MSAGAVPARGDTLLWLVDAAAPAGPALDGYAGWLGEGERQRCARFVRPERRRQFIAGRVLLRLALGRLLGLAPRAIVLHERPGNAPLLETPAPPGTGFSISHSGPWVACAASTVCALGLDIERIDAQRDVLALAEQALGPDAVCALHALAGDARVHAFYRLWCLHEAAIKLGGTGAAAHVFERPGLALALRTALPLPAAPVPLLVQLAELTRDAD